MSKTPSCGMRAGSSKQQGGLKGWDKPCAPSGDKPCVPSGDRLGVPAPRSHSSNRESFTIMLS